MFKGPDLDNEIMNCIAKHHFSVILLGIDYEFKKLIRVESGNFEKKYVYLTSFTRISSTT